MGMTGDVVEARAIRDIFQEHAHSGRLAFSSTKVHIILDAWLWFRVLPLLSRCIAFFYLSVS